MEKDIGSSSKLNFYGEIENKYSFENYLDFINNRQHNTALTKLRISADRLHIETGTYDYNLPRYINTPQGERTCSVCVNEIEDEYHLLFECEKNKALRKEFYRKITPIKSNFVTMNNSEKVQFLFNLSSLPEIEKGTTCDFLNLSFSQSKGESYMISQQHTKQIFSFLFYF